MPRYISHCIAVSVLTLITCRGQIPCIKEDFLIPNQPVELDLNAKRNQTGHWMSNIKYKADPRYQNSLKVKLQQYISENAGVQSLNVNVMLLVPPPRPTDYELFPGIGYYKFHTDNPVKFDDAHIRCSKEGGHLAIINSDEESKILQKIFASRKVNSEWAYVGFHDRCKEGEFLTIFGEPLNSTGFIRWSHSHQPDGKTGENCGSVNKNGGLNDINCNMRLPFFCEFDLAWESM